MAISKLTGVEIQLPENDLVETAYAKLKKIFVTEKPFVFRGKFLLLLIIATYMIMFFFNMHDAFLALQKSARVLLKILPIFAVVILFTALINYALQPKQIVKHLGEGSGVKSWFVALSAGVISHGPMYAWYPMIENLRNHGVRDGLIASFFYARAIKVPLLPLMIDYFGLTFTIILSLYTLIAALFQGWLLELWNDKNLLSSQDQG